MNPLNQMTLQAAHVQAVQATQLGRFGANPMMGAQYGMPGYAHMLHGQGTRKNATRESTQQLKMWLNEHQKNPYPTKAEKIMLALLSGMTLTQVSTWFANARRRLKKENKWSPDGSCDDGSDNGESVSDQSEKRIPSTHESAHESGYSSSDRSDRDAGSPPVVIPSNPPSFSMHPAMMGHMIEHIPIASTQKDEKRLEHLRMPRFMPRAQLSRTSTKPRQARSLWSIADIAGETNEPDEVDVTA